MVPLKTVATVGTKMVNYSLVSVTILVLTTGSSTVFVRTLDGVKHGVTSTTRTVTDVPFKVGRRLTEWITTSAMTTRITCVNLIKKSGETQAFFLRFFSEFGCFNFDIMLSGFVFKL